MKKLMIILLLAFVGNIMLAQTPNPAKDNFKSKYPDATNVYWSPVKDNTYKVNYSDKDVKHALVYDKSGNVISEEVELNSAAVPATIADYYKKRNADNSTPESTYTVWEVKDKSGKVTYYSEYQGKVAYFDKDGNITTKTGMATGDEVEPMDKKAPKDK